MGAIKRIIFTSVTIFLSSLALANSINDDTASYQFASSAAKIRWPGNDFNTQFHLSSSQYIGQFTVEDLDVARPITVAVKDFTAKGTITLAIRAKGNKKGVAHFYSMENGRQTSPILTFSANGKKHYLRPVSDTVVSKGVRRSQSKKTTLKASQDFTVLIQFEIPGEGKESPKITDAQLSLFLTKQQSGSSQYNLVLLPSARPAQPAKVDGIASRYPGDQGIADDPDVYHADSFDKESLFDTLAIGLGVKKQVWDNTNELEFVEHRNIQHFLPIEGKSLLIPFRTNRNLATNLDYLFSRHNGFEPEEAYFRYYLKLQTGAQVSGGGKFPGFGGTYNKAGWGGRANNGSNGWSARGAFFATVSDQGSQWANRLPIGSYLYEIDSKNRYGQTSPWGNPLSAIEPGRWYSVEQRLKLNSPGKGDGILQVWIDGQEIFLREDMNFRNTDSLKIEKIWINFYFGGTEKPAQDFNLYADNFVIAKSYIGPVKK